MNYQEIRLLLDHPAASLLRSQNAAMLLGFLYHAFKQQHRVTIPEGQLRALLEAYLDELRQAEPNQYPMSAPQYLSAWCDDAHGFLRKYYGDDPKEPLFELSSGSEKALLWLEQLQQTGFVGTESRLESIFAGLDDLLRNSTSDAGERIKQLSEEISKIQAEIDRIRTTGFVPTYTPVQINERFARLLTTARELLGDFRLVEENFKRIAQQIAEQHAKPGFTKGAILGHMLDADDALRKSEQGQSFYAFWGLLLSSERQRQFQDALAKVIALAELSEKLRDNLLLPNLVSHLLIEGEKVLDSHQRMSTNLRRVLDTTRIQDRMKVLELVHEIQAAAIPLRNSPPEESFFELEEHVEFSGSMSRPLWQAPESINLAAAVEVADDRISLEDLRKFSNLPHIRLHELRKNVDACLNESSTLTLEQVLDRFPPRHGMMEVIGYMIVALEGPKNFVSEEEQTILIPYPTPAKWRVPKILFCR